MGKKLKGRDWSKRRKRHESVSDEQDRIASWANRMLSSEYSYIDSLSNMYI